MAIVAQLYHISTGYCRTTGTFLEENKRPIPCCGTDGVVRLDGRLGRARQIETIEDRIKKIAAVRHVVGYRIETWSGQTTRAAAPYTVFENRGPVEAAQRAPLHDEDFRSN